MSKTFIFTPQGVCSRQMKVTIENDVVIELEVVGGCHGNLQGISRLIAGMKVSDVIAKLQGVDCHQRGTSCPDQLAKGLTKILQDQNA